MIALSYNNKVKKLVREAAIYIPFNCEAIRINYYDEEDSDVDAAGTMVEEYGLGRFFGTGEESGEEYTIEYSEVDLETDMFYGLVLLT